METGKRNGWLYDIFVWTGLSKDVLRKPLYEKEGLRYNLSYGNRKSTFEGGISTDDAFRAAVTVKKAMLQRKVEYKWYIEIDKALTVLSNIYYGTNPKAGPKEENKAMYSADELAEFIASICAENKWWWDNLAAHTTIYERAEMDKTKIGAALTKYKCYTSQKNEPAKKEESLTEEDHTVYVNINDYAEALAHEL